MSGPVLDRALALVVGGMGLLLVFALLRRSPRFALLAWLATVFFVPVWIGVNLFAYFPAFAIMSLLAAFSLLPSPFPVRPTVVDLALAAVLLAVLVEYALGMTTRSGAFDLVIVWASAFAVGRVFVHAVEPEWIYGACGVLGALVGALAVVEFASGQNPFISYLPGNSSLFGVWGTLQPRGPVIRAEGAFGHSIAMGTTLGVTMCFALGSRFRSPVKTLLVALAGAGVVVSFSRSGMLTAVLAVLLTVVFLRGVLSRAYRLMLVVLLGLATVAALGPILGVFASSDEAEGSALYRTDLLGLVRVMRPFGLTGDYAVSTTREVSVGSFGSIDNAVVLFGLIYGWIPLVAVALGAVGAIVALLGRRATPATIAVVAQLPGLFTVALITQYAAVAWFTAGLAIASQALGRQRSTQLEPDLQAPSEAPAPVQAESAHA